MLALTTAARQARRTAAGSGPTTLARARMVVAKAVAKGRRRLTEGMFAVSAPASVSAERLLAREMAKA